MILLNYNMCKRCPFTSSATDSFIIIIYASGLLNYGCCFGVLLTPGKLIVYNDRVYIGDVNGVPMEVVTMAHELNIGTINGLSVEQILDMMVAKGIGMGGGNSGPGWDDVVIGMPAVGSTVTMADIQWTVCHVDETAGIAYLIKTTLEEKTQFGSSTSYLNSTIANKCLTLYNTFQTDVQEALVEINVNGSVQKVFIPKAEWLGNVESTDGPGQFSLFVTNESRIAYTLYDDEQPYWTSTRMNTNHVWIVHNYGSLTSSSGYGGPSNSDSVWFRPCVAVKL